MAVVVSTRAITSRAALVERSMNDSGEQGGEAIAHVDATLIPVSVVGLGVLIDDIHCFYHGLFQQNA